MHSLNPYCLNAMGLFVQWSCIELETLGSSQLKTEPKQRVGHADTHLVDRESSHGTKELPIVPPLDYFSKLYNV